MSSLAESIKELWDTWSIRGMIILSLLLQSFLILFAPLRRQIGGKWALFVTIPLWIAYLLADWVAVFTIGLILRAQHSGILALWSSFLLLHLGGPDTITSFSIEDNELWIRHLLGLLSRVGSSVYIILLSPSNCDVLWLPTLLVLIAGIIKYAERIRAFYLASFDQFGDNWKKPNEHMPPVPAQFSKMVDTWRPGPVSNHEALVKKIDDTVELLWRWGKKWVNRIGWGKPSTEKTTDDQRQPRIEVAVYLLGVIKNLLVGPPLSSFEILLDPGEMHEMLRAMEIHLSLLYELLHTKLPVVDSKTGYACRMVNLGCILGAMLSFSLPIKKHPYKLFDIWLTYGLLIGALALDLISIMLLTISSDWITIAHFQEKRKSPAFINKRRWSNSVPQLNISDKHFWNRERGCLDFPGLRNLVKKIERTRRVKFQVFEEKQEWRFIFTTLLNEQKDRASVKINYLLSQWETSLHFFFEKFEKCFPYYKDYVSTLEKFEYVESLLMWHIVTEFFHRTEVSGNSPGSPSASDGLDHKKICKLLSDYMFYLLVMEPTMLAVSPNSFKTVFEGKDKRDKTLKWLTNQMMSSRTGEIDFKVMDNIFCDHYDDSSRVKATYRLAKLFHDKRRGGDFLWQNLAEVWLVMVCHAAKSCQPIVYARQVSRGGQLLTLVWLLMNYCGLIPKNKVLTHEPNTSELV